jgi:exonuclease VII small subunit
MPTARPGIIRERLDRATDEYLEARRARDEARAKIDGAQQRVLALTVDLYREMTGRDLRKDLKP